jgi:hypothetical protein
MFKANRTNLLLLLIFTFSFIYRMLLMLWSNFPSGADIGLHNSVIYSITGPGNTNFMHNAYQMGGGTSLTFPGYHIFASSIMLMTGLPEYVAQATIVALFSSLIVLCAFLVTKRIWSTSAAFIIAFLVAISRFDIEMTLWGGYPNVITLMLIPLTFYLYLQKDRFSLTPFLVSTSILAGSIFLTHSLSAGIFVLVTFLTVIFVFISPKKFGTTRKTCLHWLLPVVIGVVLVSPFLMQAIPTYLSDNSSAPGVSGVQNINFAILSTRILPLEFVLPLFAIILAFVVFSKTYKGRFLSLPVLLLSVWLFVPLFLTQGYLFGFIIDYNRFLYFIILPVLIFIAVLIDHGSGFFAETVDFYRALPKKIKKSKTTQDGEIKIGNKSTFISRIQSKLDNRMEKSKKSTYKKLVWLSTHLTHKAVYGIFILFFLVFSFVFIPIFMTPSQNVGETIQSFYQVMNNPGWEAIQWAKQNTPANSVFVSDALYGWWFSGFAQRPTLSAVDPQYLTSAREVNPAMNATNLLDTDYLVDNGVVQVREDGGYIARHNPEILATLNWTYFPHSFFNFDSSNIQIFYTVNGNMTSVTLDQLTVKQMQMQKITDENNNVLTATVTVVRGNDYFNYTQLTTVYKGLPFVNMTTTIDAGSGTSLNLLLMTIESKGYQVSYPDMRTVCMIDEGVKAFGQLIFNVNQPAVNVLPVAPRIIDLQYNLQGKSQAQLQISASAYSVTDNLQYYKDSTTVANHFAPMIAANLNTNQTPTNTPFKQTFDYQAEIQNHSVSYIACRVPEMFPKFQRDPTFSLVFINSEVAIFKVNGNLNQNG